MVFYNAFYSVCCNVCDSDVVVAAEPVAGDAEVLVAWAIPVDAAVAADVESVPVLAALVAVVVGVVQKEPLHLSSTSLKLLSETSSWHFFFVSYNRQLHTNLFLCGCCFITLSAICDTAIRYKLVAASLPV